jgi:hypothetical protein
MSVLSTFIVTVAALVSIGEASRRIVRARQSKRFIASVSIGHALDYGPRVIDLNHPAAPQIKRYVIVVTLLNGDSSQFLTRLCVEDVDGENGVDVSSYLNMAVGGSTPRELRPREPVLAEIPAFELAFDTSQGFQVVGYLSTGRVSSGIEHFDADLLAELEKHNRTVA